MLGDSTLTTLHAAMKHISVEAVEATIRPSKFIFGTVFSTSPLQIQVDQRTFIDAEFLILTDAVRDYYVDITVDHQTNTESEHTHQYFDSDTGQGASGSTTRTSDPTTHLHGYSGRKRFLIHNGLQVGEKVILLQNKGGQQFLILNRVV